jgi:preprotein translocase subunit SecE
VEAGGESSGETQAQRAAGARARQAGGERRRRTGAVQFVRECIAELHKVQWPTRHELWQATAVVLIVTTVIGFYIFALDSIFVPFAGWLVRHYRSF